eukprot:7213011-Prymnesium_polylepis.1
MPPLSKPLSQDPATDPFYIADGSTEVITLYPLHPHASYGPPVKTNPRDPTRNGRSPFARYAHNKQVCVLTGYRDEA